MRVLIVGGGGREHTLAWKINQSPLVEKIFCVPGNPGISSIAECIQIPVTDIKGLLEFALKEKIDLTVVGPEDPLVNGITDIFNERGLQVFGPNKKAAALEGSKVFAKDFMQEVGVPTAEYKVFTNPSLAIDYLKGNKFPIVVKAEGLAAGKGVIIAENMEEAEIAVNNIMIDKVFGSAGNRLVVEEFLVGEEASLLAFTDGETIIPMVSAQDHKAAFDGDQGPNTGGMGAYAPAPIVTPTLLKEVEENVFKPVIQGLKNRGIVYRGVLYAGLMLTMDGPKVLEFNVRFGDPETQAVLPLLKSDIIPIMTAVVKGSLAEVNPQWHEGSAACVAMASGGYPGDYEKGFPIEGIEDANLLENVIVFHAGTGLENGETVTAGGRVLGVTGRGDNLKEAIRKSYNGIEKIHFKDCHYRKDIGYKGLNK